MNKRTLGRTGLQVSELALGGLFVSSLGGDGEQSRQAVLKALASGINYIDTAPGYANSEMVLGSILRDVSVPVILSTKLGGRPEPFDPRNKAALLQSVEESLQLLNREHLDILMIHEPDRPLQYDWWTDPVEYCGPVLEVLEELKKGGLIKYTGLGGTTAYEIVRIMQTDKFDVVLTAFNYSLLWREAEHELLPTAIARNMGIIIGSPLQQGVLSRRFEEEVKGGAPWLSLPRRAQFIALYEFLDEIKLSLPELALRFVLSNSDVSCVLTGVRSAAEVDLNVRAAEQGALSPQIMNRINEIAAMVPFRPYEEPLFLPFGREYQGPGPAR